MKLLCLSNGHGEDVIAVQILKQLQQQTNNIIEIQALAIVGEGSSYKAADIPLIGPAEPMPSGGFIYQDIKQFGRDLKGGLFGLTLAQYQAIRQWHQLHQGIILAVGDIVPLLFAWLVGANYAFVGTAKSDYYLRHETDWFKKTCWFERVNGSVYLPWERWLMSRPQCKAVFPRDSLTAQTLKKWSIPVFDLGNPMMDGITPNDQPFSPPSNLSSEALTILLLPGSRLPETLNNWKILLDATREIIATFSHTQLTFIAAIAQNVTPLPLREYLLTQAWKPLLTPPRLFEERGPGGKSNLMPEGEVYTLNPQATLIISQNAYSHCLIAADVALAMAGTATEQFIGLGKPAIIIPGEGPQFTYRFAEAQTRLLGRSVILVPTPQQVAESIQRLIEHPKELEAIAINGKQRMGNPGAAKRIAATLTKLNKDL